MHIVLSIAGSDSIGGAGMQADLKALASMDVHGASAFTAITAQNTQRVAKINAVLDDAEVSAVKTGMLHSAEIARAVSKRLSQIEVPLVIDPVMVAGVGDKLHSKNLLAALKDHVIPMATIVTPNRMEAELISSMTIDHLTDAEKACKIIAELGAKAVLLKGGHFEGDEIVDLLYYDDKMFELAAPRIPIKVHGGGCTLASYIAGNLAKGMSIKASVLDAKRRINDGPMSSTPWPANKSRG
jgi:hydroxymethylpyrimidine kinase/phosphomethylpyrimidine kinase